MSMLKDSVRHTYAGWPTLERVLRESGFGSGKITHLVSVERIDDMPERDEVRAHIDGNSNIRPTLALVERHVTDEGHVGTITRVIVSDEYTSHFELHMAARSWMMCQTYPMDFAPQSCKACDVGSRDENWLTNYLAAWLRRLGR